MSVRPDADLYIDQAQRLCWPVRCSDGFGTCRTAKLRSLKQELNFHSLEREDDSPAFGSVEHSGVQ